MTIRDALQNTKNFPRYDGEIGVEIETETLRDYRVPEFHYWNSQADGSLRNFGVEYVLKQPVLHKELNVALEEFADKTQKIPFIKDSITTGVHVHLNFLNENFNTLGNFLTAYTLYENLLIRYSGPDRLSNLFCLPICDAEETYKNIVQMFKGISIKNYRAMNFDMRHVKYAALNLSSIMHFGSVEVRSFRGETDIRQIHDWASILYSLLEFSRSDITPRELMNEYKENPERLISNVFKDYRENIRQNNERELIDKNVFYAASIAYAVKNWKELDIKQEPPKFNPKAKERNDAAMANFGKKFAELTPAEADFVLETLYRDYLRKNALVDNRNAQPNPAAEIPIEVAMPEARVRRARVVRDAPVPLGGGLGGQPMEWRVNQPVDRNAAQREAMQRFVDMQFQNNPFLNNDGEL